ncbi:MAG TPA: dethiobiotin synthase [Coxiellaceae bacterium]|nr:dethiobiotin synthase [Coxiellaceae bacterium]
MTKRLFITGTHTDAGKTYAACALLNSFNQRGFSTLGLKPVASGAIMTADGLRSQDALALQSASSLKLDYQHVNPFLFEPPIAPHIAAQAAQQNLSVKNLMAACETALEQNVDCIVIEGAGGWLVPLNDQEYLADFAEALAAEIILVVGMRLGCINHALLTLRDIEQRGLSLAGWIANCIDPDMLHLEENIEFLQAHISAPLLATLPHQAEADPSSVFI